MLLRIGQYNIIIGLIIFQSVFCSVEILNYISENNMHLQQNPNKDRINMTATSKGHYIDHADNRASYFPPGENVWSITAIHQFLFGDTEIYSNNTRAFFQFWQYICKINCFNSLNEFIYKLMQLNYIIWAKTVKFVIKSSNWILSHIS